jgi:hypothetical protein
LEQNKKRGRCAARRRQNVDGLISAFAKPLEQHKNAQTVIRVRGID